MDDPAEPTDRPGTHRPTRYGSRGSCKTIGVLAWANDSLQPERPTSVRADGQSGPAPFTRLISNTTGFTQSVQHARAVPARPCASSHGKSPPNCRVRK